MSLKYLALNALLCLVVFLIAIKNYEIWNSPVEVLPNTGIESKKAETKNENPAVTASAKETMPVQSPIQSYVPISEKNIFSPDRKDFPTVAVNKPNPATRPKLILYGVTIAGDYQAASVVNPGRPLRKGERETMTLKAGEKIGEYRLAKVLADRITMENGNDSFEVLLYDPRNPKKRMEVRTETKTTEIAGPSSPTATPLSTPPTTGLQDSDKKPKEAAQQQAVSPPPAPMPTPVHPQALRRGFRPPNPLLAPTPSGTAGGTPGQTN